MSKQIALSKGQYAIVDDQDYEWLSRQSWHVTSHSYAANSKRNAKKITITLMHRAIMEHCGYHIENLMIDHINGNRLDNRRENLRMCNGSQNAANSRKTTSLTSSKYKGVTWSKQSKCWLATIKIDGVLNHLGSFKSEDEDKAAVAYNKAALEAWGEFAHINVISNEGD